MRQFYGEYMEASVDNARLEAEDKMKAGMTKERLRPRSRMRPISRNGMKGGRIMPLNY